MATANSFLTSRGKLYVAVLSTLDTLYFPLFAKVAQPRGSTNKADGINNSERPG